ncbi:MAG TPA: flavodoxin family protein [Dehalococcoidales bacterium]|nr:flavodoxin family protein [Dehalococcoidales bacterium]
MGILILSGSRNREGKTARAIEAICRGIQAAGGQSEVVFLPELKLERCRQCHLDGQGPCVQEGACVIPDDFEIVASKVRDADVLVVANPVYFGELTESLRAFLDRFRRTVFAPPGLAPKAVSLAVKGKPAVGLCYAGFRGGFAVTCAVSLERALQTCGLDVVDLILARRQNLEVKLPMLELTGRWLVTQPTS